MQMENLNQNIYYLKMSEYFGYSLIDKDIAIYYRDNYLLQAARKKRYNFG